MIFLATVKVRPKDKRFFPLPLLLLWLDLGSGIRDPRSGIRDPRSGIDENQDPGSGINIPELQHCYRVPYRNKIFGNYNKKSQVATNEPGIPFREGLLSTSGTRLSVGNSLVPGVQTSRFPISRSKYTKK